MAAIYSRHLQYKMLIYFAATLAALVASVWLVQTLKLMEVLTKGGISLWTFLEMAFYLVIPLLYVCTPLALFMAAIFSLNSANNAGELLILKASGLSNKEILKGFFKIIIVIWALNSVISLYLLPLSYKEFRHMHYSVRDGILRTALEEEVFTSYGNGLTFYVEKQQEDGVYRNIFISDNRKPNEEVTLIAKTGQFFKSDKGMGVVLFDGTHQTKNNATRRINIGFFDQYQFIITIEKGGRDKDPKANNAGEMRMAELWDKNGKNLKTIRQHRIQAFQRVAWPILGVLLCLLSLQRSLQLSMGRHNTNLRYNMTTFGIGIVVIAVFLTGVNLAVTNPVYLGLVLLATLMCIVLIVLPSDPLQ